MNTKNITEDDIAAYLFNTPDFFERNPDLLASIQLTSPHGQRAVSLQERQMELLREKIKGIELRMANLIRTGSANDNTHQKLLDWTLTLLEERIAQRIPQKIVNGLQNNFSVPQVALRLWAFDDGYATSIYAHPVSDNIQSFVKSMNGEPYCGRNPDLEAIQWLETPNDIQSVALLPIYVHAPQQPFGLLVLGSPDAQRFTADMGIEILKNIATIASAALLRCTHDNLRASLGL